jgi:hypothetical protein
LIYAVRFVAPVPAWEFNGEHMEIKKFKISRVDFALTDSGETGLQKRRRQNTRTGGHYDK